MQNSGFDIYMEVNIRREIIISDCCIFCVKGNGVMAFLWSAYPAFLLAICLSFNLVQVPMLSQQTSNLFCLLNICTFHSVVSITTFFTLTLAPVVTRQNYYNHNFFVFTDPNNVTYISPSQMFNLILSLL